MRAQKTRCMTFEADPGTGPVLHITRDTAPVPWVRVRLALRVALDTYISLGVTCLAGLEVPSCLDCVFMDSRSVTLTIGAKHQVRFDPQTSFREAVVALRAVFLIMAAIAALRIIQRLDRMDIDKITPMAFGNVIPAEGFSGKIRVYSASLMTVETERLIMALDTIAAPPTCKGTVAPHPVSIVVGRDPFALVAFVAFGDLHVGVFFVRLFLGRSLPDVQGRHNKKHTNEQQCLHF
jgi:hypothetical protein